jgi:foldase protein PrsA
MKRVSKLKLFVIAVALVVAAVGCEAPSTTSTLPPTIGEKIPANHGAATSPGAEQLGAAPEGMANPHGSHGGAGTPSAISQLAKTAAIVKVDDVVITKADLDRAMAQAAALAGIPPEMLDGEMKTAFEQPAYEKLIERNLLAKEARARKMWPSDAEVKAKREEMLKSLPAGKTLQDVLGAIGADEKSFDEDLRIDVALASLLKSLESEVKPIDDAALAKIYEENKKVFVVPDTASAAHILIKVDRAAGSDVVAEKKKAAEAIMKEVVGKDDATFARVAAEKSDDASGKARGGDLGTFKKGDLFPEFEAMAFKLKEGEIGGPVQTERGFHIIRGGGAEKGRELPSAEAKKIITERERVKGFLAAVDALVSRLRTGAKIERLVEPAPSPLVDPNESGSRVPAWKASGKNAVPGMANPHGAPGASH